MLRWASAQQAEQVAATAAAIARKKQHLLWPANCCQTVLTRTLEEVLVHLTAVLLRNQHGC